MHINLILIPFIIILGIFLSRNDNKKHRLSYIIICFVVLAFIAAMRSPEWMQRTYHIDTMKYKEMFESTFTIGWDEFGQDVYARYFLKTSEWDIGFVGLNKLISLFTHEFYIFSLIADLIFFIPFGIILYRFTTNILQIMFAIVFYVALVQIFFFGGARQMFAIGFDMMALLSIIDKRVLRTIMFFLLGISIHFSSILFVLPLLMIWMGIKVERLKTLHIICLLLFPFVMAFPNQLITYMGNFVGMEKYSAYGQKEIQGGADTFIFLIETLSFFCFLAISRIQLTKNNAVRICYVMAPLFSFFAPLITSNGSMIRISLYYHIFLSLLVPYAIDCGFGQKRKPIYFVAIGLLSLLTLADGGLTYYFFWQI